MYRSNINIGATIVMLRIPHHKISSKGRSCHASQRLGIVDALASRRVAQRSLTRLDIVLLKDGATRHPHYRLQLNSTTFTI